MTWRPLISATWTLALMSAAGAMLGCAPERCRELAPGRDAAAADGAAASRAGTLLGTVLASRSAFAAMLTEEIDRRPYTRAAEERVDALLKTSHPLIMNVDQFRILIARSRVVFVSDVHDDTAV